MPAKITLRVIKGKGAGDEFVFDERTTCVIGRAQDLNPRVPSDPDHKVISRHHCLIDINPPDIRIRDFGSLNGTYVNGKKIGQRDKQQTPEEAAKILFPEQTLKSGDQIKLVNTTFCVDIFVPAVCAECAREIPEDHKAQAQREPGLYQCEDCRKKAEAARRKEPPRKKAKVCARCGRDVAAEMGDQRQGEFVCAACQADPLQIIKLLLELAKSKRGDPSLLPIQGYSIQKKLGEGGMGAVYLARNDRTGEQVALKIMLPKVAVDPMNKVLFQREVADTRVLNHRNVVHLRDHGCSNGVFFFTLEYCDGGSVDQVMRARRRTLAIAEAGAIILEALEGLEHAHTVEFEQPLADGRSKRVRGLVHRDLKPPNLLLAGTGVSRVAKVGDFGLAKAFDTAGLSGNTMSGAVAGTVAFMPRQQVLDFKYVKPDVDVWAMAASLYYMLTACPPHNFPEGVDPYRVVLDTKAVPIRQRDSSIPKALAQLIDEALIDRPAITIKTAAELKRALERVL